MGCSEFAEQKALLSEVAALSATLGGGDAAGGPRIWQRGDDALVPCRATGTSVLRVKKNRWLLDVAGQRRNRSVLCL